MFPGVNRLGLSASVAPSERPWPEQSPGRQSTRGKSTSNAYCSPILFLCAFAPLRETAWHFRLVLHAKARSGMPAFAPMATGPLSRRERVRVRTAYGTLLWWFSLAGMAVELPPQRKHPNRSASRPHPRPSPEGRGEPSLLPLPKMERGIAVATCTSSMRGQIIQAYRFQAVLLH